MVLAFCVDKSLMSWLFLAAFGVITLLYHRQALC
jgi:hypothetical protein